MRNLDKYITIEAAMSEIYLTDKTIKYMCDQNMIPYYNDRGMILVNPADINALIETLIAGDLSKKPKPKKKVVPSPEEQPAKVSPDETE